MGSPLPWASKRQDAHLFAHLDRLAALGCTAFDLATVYQFGGSERAVGRWIASRKNRDSLFLLGKGGHPFGMFAPNRVQPTSLESDLHGALKRLRTDRLDLFLMHRDHPASDIKPLIECFGRFLRDGKILGWGVSNWSHDRIEAARKVALELGIAGPSVSSPHFSLARWNKVPWPGCVSIAGDSKALSYYSQTQTAVVAWSPLGQGYFSDQPPPFAQRIFGSSANQARKDRARELAAKKGASMAQIALAYLFNQPFPVHAVIASSSPERMKANLEAVKIPLTADELLWLENGDEKRN